ncbi:MAG TPA: hypothetical protein DCS67_08865 [Clostridiales bacterium UBA8960]|nr:hypothetical protein [Clostridiales bacterium UBA8960]
MNVSKTIMSGIPFHRIIAYFQSISETHDLKYSKSHASSYFGNSEINIEIAPNLAPPVIRLIVPITDITFTGSEAVVDAFMAAYRLAFLSAGG